MLNLTEDPYENHGLADNTSHSSRFGPTADGDLALFQGLKPIVRELHSLIISFTTVSTTIALVDDCGRHDEAISEKLFEKVFNLCAAESYTPLARARTELSCALEATERLANALRGQFRGKLKNQLEARINNHLLEAKNLAALLLEQHQAIEIPNRPYLIRQKLLASFHVDMTSATSLIRELRRGLKDQPLSDQFFELLSEQEVAVYKLRAVLAKLRDNPSQRMKVKVNESAIQLESIHRSLEALQQAAMRACQLSGMYFFDRRGPLPIMH